MKEEEKEMRVHIQPRCMRCGKMLGRGDAVIRTRAQLLYHPECYKEDRKKTSEDLIELYQRFLREAHSYLDSFKSLVGSNSIKDHSIFYRAWGNQLISLSLLDAVLGNAENFGNLGFIQKIRLGRRLEQYRTALIEIGTYYRKVYGAIRIEREMKELYPSSGEPTIDQLKEEEERALQTLEKQIVDLCEKSEKLHTVVQKVSRETGRKIRQEMERQIQRIPELIETL